MAFRLFPLSGYRRSLLSNTCSFQNVSIKFKIYEQLYLLLVVFNILSSTFQELYLAFNKVSDLSPVGMLENLQVLDLEGNDVNDLVQVQYLRLCGKLETLTLEGNPVCLQPNPTTTQVGQYVFIL